MAVRIINQSDPSDVHVIETDIPKGTSNYDRMMDGIYRKVDFDRYYVEED